MWKMKVVWCQNIVLCIFKLNLSGTPLHFFSNPAEKKSNTSPGTYFEHFHEILYFCTSPLTQDKHTETVIENEKLNGTAQILPKILHAINILLSPNVRPFWDICTIYACLNSNFNVLMQRTPKFELYISLLHTLPSTKVERVISSKISSKFSPYLYQWNWCKHCICPDSL